MLKRKSLIVLTLVIAFVALFAAGEVMAFSTEPCSNWNYTDNSCKPPPMPTDCSNPYKDNGDPSGWTVELCISDHPGRTDLKDYKYKAYNSNGTSSGLKKINWFCPQCCTDPVMVVDEGLSSPNINVESAGDGSPTGAFKNFLQGFVVWSPPADEITYTLVTNALQTTEGTVLLELAGNDVPISFPVPGCALAAPAPPVGGKNFSQCINFGADTPDSNDDVSHYYTRNPTVEGCVEEAWFCNKWECPGCTEGTCTNILPEPPTPIASGAEGCWPMDEEDPPINVRLYGNVHPVCQDESIEITEWPGSTYYLYTINSGGITRKICYDVSVSPPVKVDRCNCKPAGCT